MDAEMELQALTVTTKTTAASSNACGNDAALSAVEYKRLSKDDHDMLRRTEEERDKEIARLQQEIESLKVSCRILVSLTPPPPSFPPSLDHFL